MVVVQPVLPARLLVRTEGVVAAAVNMEEERRRREWERPAKVIMVVQVDPIPIPVAVAAEPARRALHPPPVDLGTEDWV